MHRQYVEDSHSECVDDYQPVSETVYRNILITASTCLSVSNTQMPQGKSNEQKNISATDISETKKTLES